ncbi:MAG: carbohydrate kinase family protein [Chitinophagaceae bacterium]|nr:carbohydrate kinase family protein [Chitinophagaceae bacterium]
MKKIFIIGGTTFDHIVYLPELPGNKALTLHKASFQETIGSTGAGKAINLTKLGVKNTLYSVLGDDYYGKQIEQNLHENKIDFFIDIDPVGTERHINIMDDEGKRISMFITQSSESINYNTQKIDAAAKDADIIVLNIISYCRNIIPIIEKYNKPVWTDLHDYDGSNSYHNDFIRASQFIHMSSDNLPDYNSVMERFINEGKELAICTHAKKGATLLTKDGIRIEQPAILSYPMTDANGAGDSFFSGFLYGWINNQSYERCMQMGAVCAGLCINSKELASDFLSANYLNAELRRLDF